jgi:hypothetical protein
MGDCTDLKLLNNGDGTYMFTCVPQCKDISLPLSNFFQRPAILLSKSHCTINLSKIALSPFRLVPNKPITFVKFPSRHQWYDPAPLFLKF